MEYVDSGNNEWDQMWIALSQYPINDGDPLCINVGHSWEYMGSTLDHHHFRHECHPKTESTEYIYIERCRAAIGWI